MLALLVNIHFLPCKLPEFLKKQGFWPKINCGQMKLPNFVSSSGDGSSKIGHDFSNKLVQKLKLSINDFYKNLSLNGYSSIKKKSERF